MNLALCRGLALGVSLVGLQGAVTGIARAEDVRAAVHEGNQQWAAALARGDAAAIATLYSSTAMLFAPGSAVAKGREAIRKAAQGLIDSGVSGIELDTLELEACGDFAFESGTLVLKGKDGAVVDRGKYVVVWKREEARWKLHRDIFNTNLASPAR